MHTPSQSREIKWCLMIPFADTLHDHLTGNGMIWARFSDTDGSGLEPTLTRPQRTKTKEASVGRSRVNYG